MSIKRTNLLDCPDKPKIKLKPWSAFACATERVKRGADSKSAKMMATIIPTCSGFTGAH